MPQAASDAGDAAPHVEDTAADVAHTAGQPHGSRAKTTLLVTNIPAACDYTHIEAVVGQQLGYYQLVKYKASNTEGSAGVAWVLMQTEEHCEAVQEALQGFRLEQHTGTWIGIPAGQPGFAGGAR